MYDSKGKLATNSKVEIELKKSLAMIEKEEKSFKRNLELEYSKIFQDIKKENRNETKEEERLSKPKEPLQNRKASVSSNSPSLKSLTHKKLPSMSNRDKTLETTTRPYREVLFELLVGPDGIDVEKVLCLHLASTSVFARCPMSWLKLARNTSKLSSYSDLLPNYLLMFPDTKKCNCGSRYCISQVVKFVPCEVVMQKNCEIEELMVNIIELLKESNPSKLNDLQKLALSRVNVQTIVTKKSSRNFLAFVCKSTLTEGKIRIAVSKLMPENDFENSYLGVNTLFPEYNYIPYPIDANSTVFSIKSSNAVFAIHVPRNYPTYESITEVEERFPAEHPDESCLYYNYLDESNWKIRSHRLINPSQPKKQGEKFSPLLKNISCKLSSLWENSEYDLLLQPKPSNSNLRKLIPDKTEEQKIFNKLYEKLDERDKIKLDNELVKLQSFNNQPKDKKQISRASLLTEVLSKDSLVNIICGSTKEERLCLLRPISDGVFGFASKIVELECMAGVISSNGLYTVDINNVIKLLRNTMIPPS